MNGKAFNFDPNPSKQVAGLLPPVLLLFTLLFASCGPRQHATLATSPNPTVPDQRGRTDLMVAAAWGELTKIRREIGSGAVLNQRDGDGRTAIMYSSLYCHYDAFLMLEQSGADLFLADVRQLTTLHHAARGGCRALARYFIAKELPLEPSDKYGRTPLMSAAAYHRPGIVQDLIEAGSVINLTDHEGKTALFLAVESYAKDQKRISQEQQAALEEEAKAPDKRTFLERTGDFFRDDVWGNIKAFPRRAVEWTRRQWQAVKARRKKRKEGLPRTFPVVEPGGKESAEQVVTLLLEAGADAKRADNSGKTPLALAKEYGLSDIFRILSTPLTN